MRPDEIDAVLGRIGKAWRKCPELRLGQLLLDAMPESTAALFYFGDWDLVKAVEEFATMVARANAD